MDELLELLHDPRPTLPDSMRWRCLFIQIHRIGLAPEKAIQLARTMWMFRNMGTTLRRDLRGLRFDCILEPEGYWESVEEYRELKHRLLLGVHKDAIVELLSRVESIVDFKEVHPDSKITA